MMLSRVTFVVIVMTGLAAAQTDLTAPRPAPSVGPGSGVRASKAATPGNPQAGKMRSSAAKTKLSRPAPKSPAASAAVKKTPAGPARAAAAKPNSAAPAGPKALRGRRDPFVSIIRPEVAGTVNCTTGKKCLVPNLVVLRGVVKAPDGMLAVVENPQRKSYFLRERDPVFNGEVVRITPDSIVFREKVLDKRGRELTREIVKRVPGSKPSA